MANSKNVMAQVILAWDTIIQGRSKHHPRLQHLPHPHPYIHRPLPLPHPISFPARSQPQVLQPQPWHRGENLLENEKHNFLSKSEVLTVLQTGYMFVCLLVIKEHYSSDRLCDGYVSVNLLFSEYEQVVLTF